MPVKCCKAPLWSRKYNAAIIERHNRAVMPARTRNRALPDKGETLSSSPQALQSSYPDIPADYVTPYHSPYDNLNCSCTVLFPMLQEGIACMICCYAYVDSMFSSLCLVRNAIAGISHGRGRFTVVSRHVLLV
jgi:hypothetical protein